MNKTELLHNAVIINEGERCRGWISITTDGTIGEVGRGEVPSALMSRDDVAAIDMQGHWLLPGVIDPHVHFREPGMEHKGNIYTESRAAAAGGVTSVMEMPNTNPATTTIEALDDKYARAAEASAVNYAFFIGATGSNIDILRSVDYSRVPGIKLFMGSSTGGMLVDESDALESLFELPTLIMTHCEQEEIIRSNMQCVQQLYPSGDAPVSWHPEIRSVMACYASTCRAVRLAQRKGTRLHVAHVSTCEDIELFSPEYPDITAEACVAHLIFTDDDYATLGTRIKCNPAVKSRRHRSALRAAVASGRISTVSTDHAPHTLNEKLSGTITAPSGMPMVQYSLPAMLHMSKEGLWTPEQVVERMCHAQARIFRVEKRGFLRPGYYADIVEVDPNGMTEVTAAGILSKCGWSPLEGKTLNARVISTRINGACAYRHDDPGTTGNTSAPMPLRFAL